VLHPSNKSEPDKSSTPGEIPPSKLMSSLTLELSGMLSLQELQQENTKLCNWETETKISIWEKVSQRLLVMLLTLFLLPWKDGIQSNRPKSITSWWNNSTELKTNTDFARTNSEPMPFSLFHWQLLELEPQPKTSHCINTSNHWQPWKTPQTMFCPPQHSMSSTVESTEETALPCKSSWSYPLEPQALLMPWE